MKKTIKIATRGSKLALYQANKVKDELQAAFPEHDFQIQIFTTKGDKILNQALSKIGDKGLFTKELEVSLLNNESDIAVHSLKDLPTQLPEGLKLGAILARADFRDALVSVNGKKLNELDETDVIATSSLRRKAQLLKINPNFKIVDIRGNVDTRLNKMKDGYCTAMVMAAAGLIRLGYENVISEILNPEDMIPAVGQGAIAVEMRQNDPFLDEILSKINDSVTMKTTQAERTYLRLLEGGCQVPVGCHSVVDGEKYTIIGFVSGIDGQKFLKSQASSTLNNSVSAAKELAEKLLALGAAEILNEIRKEAI
jgi:hydroxymethylbilane synthase